MYKSLFDDAHAQLRINRLLHSLVIGFILGWKIIILFLLRNKEDGNSLESVLHDITIKLRLLLSLFWLKDPWQQHRRTVHWSIIRPAPWNDFSQVSCMQN